MTRVDGRGLFFDALAVVVFVAIGRMQHDGDGAFAPDEVLRTLWPFLGGLLIAVVVLTISATTYSRVAAGGAVALLTALCGLALRYASGQGIAVSFAIVTLIVLGVLMIGWRLIVNTVSRA